MVLMAKSWSVCRSIGIGAFLVLLAAGELALSGCAFLYPERSTPLRGAVSEDAYTPPPPKDVMFVALKSARIPPKTRDGRSWDKMGGEAPDPYAILFVADQEVLRTSVVSNSLRPEWPNPVPANLRIPRAAKVRVEVWDDNALVSHPICNQGIRDIEEAVGVGTLEVECDSGATVILVVEPPKARLGIGLFYEVRGKEVFVSRVIAASAAGRAELKPGDQILSVSGHPIRELESGELEGLLSMESSKGFDMEIRSLGGGARYVHLRDEPMYPVKGEGIELLIVQRAAAGD